MVNIVYIATSIDMLIAQENNDMGWLDFADDLGDDYGYFDFYKPIDIVVMGKKTFLEGVRLGGGKNPYPDKPTVIFTKSGYESEYENVVSEDDPVRYLRQNRDKRIWVVGGGEIVSLLHNTNLIDEYMLSIMPIILGKGIPMFTQMEREHALTLKDTKHYDNGIVQLHYIRNDNNQN